MIEFSDVKTCGGLWHLTGTCCDIKLATEQATTKADQVVKKTKELNKILFTLRKEMEGKINSWKSDNISIPEVSFLHRLTRNGFNDSITNCWNHMNQARSAAYCFVCAGSSPSYIKDNKALVSIDTCTSLLGECKDFFYDIMSLVKALNTLGNITTSRSSTKEEKKWIEELNHKFEKLDLINDIMNLEKSTIPAIKSQLSSKLCGTLVKVAKKSFIEDLHPLIDFLDKKSEKIVYLVSNLIKERGRSRMLGKGSRSSTSTTTNQSTSNWGSTQSANSNSNSSTASNSTSSCPYEKYNSSNSQGYSCQSLNFATPDEVVEGDIAVIAQHDNMFSSYAGSNSLSCSQMKPMNLTMMFP